MLCVLSLKKLRTVCHKIVTKLLQNYNFGSASEKNDLQRILKEVWGFEALRIGQEEVVRNVVAGHDVLAVLPTGGGKSLCYQLPALWYPDGLTLVVSPLIALMQDQVQQLQDRGVRAAALHSGLKHHEIDQILTNAEHGLLRLLYVSPERLKTEMFLMRASRLAVRLLAVDEAHCISEWGEHFRPAYRLIKETREALGMPPIIAVTATATPIVRKEIRTYLGLTEPKEIVNGFDRPNISWSVFKTDRKREKVSDIINKVAGNGIIYASTRQRVEEWATWLRDEGIAAEAYHAGMSNVLREKAQEAWMRGKARIMVATNAFGMGIDKPDVRFVVHVDLPATIEAYYQEAGRAGRDGQKSFAILLWDQQDVKIQEGMIEEGYPSAADIQKVYEGFCALAQVAIGSLPDAPLMVQMERLQEVSGFSATKIRQALQSLVHHSVLRSVPVRKNQGQIRFLQPIETIRGYAQTLENEKLGAFLLTILRSVNAEAFSGWYGLDVSILAKRTGLSNERVEKGLYFFASRSLLAWVPADGALRFELAEARTERLLLAVNELTASKKRALVRLKHMIRFAKHVGCRRYFLLSYFGERASLNCGKCDHCLGRHKPEAITPDDEPHLKQILRYAADQTPQEVWDAFRELPDGRVEGLVEWLLHEGWVGVKEPLRGTFHLTAKALKKMDWWK